MMPVFYFRKYIIDDTTIPYQKVLSVTFLLEIRQKINKECHY